MAEGGAERPVYHIHTQSLNIVAQKNIEEVNINESVIQEISSAAGGVSEPVHDSDSTLRRRQNTEIDSTQQTSITNTRDDSRFKKPSSMQGYLNDEASANTSTTHFDDAPTGADIPLHSKGTLLKNMGSRFRSLFKESSRQTNVKEIKTEIPGKWEEQSEDTTYRFKSLPTSDDHPRKENESVAAKEEESQNLNRSVDEEGLEFAGGPVDQLLLGKKKKIEHLENELGKCLRKGEIKKYSQILKELKELLQSDDLDVILDLLEYELLSQNDDSSIEKVRVYISASGSRSASDVREQGYELYEQGDYVQAMILFKISHDLHKKEKKLSSDDELEWISGIVTNISWAIKHLVKAGGKSRDIGNKYGTTYIEELFEELSQVSDPTPDARALNELICRVNIIAINNNLGEYEKGIRFGEDGVTMMKEHFGEKASNYKFFGMLLHNLGISYCNSGQYERAEHCYVTAIEVESIGLRK